MEKADPEGVFRECVSAHRNVGEKREVTPYEKNYDRSQNVSDRGRLTVFYYFLLSQGRKESVSEK